MHLSELRARISAAPVVGTVTRADLDAAGIYQGDLPAFVGRGPWPKGAVGPILAYGEPATEGDDVPIYDLGGAVTTTADYLRLLVGWLEPAATIAQEMIETARDMERSARRQKERDAEIAEIIRSPTAEEVATIDGLIYFLGRLDADQIGSDRGAIVCGEVEAALARLAQTSPDVDATGKPTPGRGPRALLLNAAKSRMLAARSCFVAGQHDDAAHEIRVTRSMLLLGRGEGAAVGSG